MRKGEFEGLRDAVAKGERLPDFGPHAIGSGGGDRRWGSQAARRVQRLPDRDEAAAKEIARTIRESNGGLPALRAIGFAVPERGCSTVSMNLVDFTTTGVRAAYDAVVAQAGHAARRCSTPRSSGSSRGGVAARGRRARPAPGFDRATQVLERLVEEAA